MIFNTVELDLTLIAGVDDGIDERSCRGAKRYLTNRQLSFFESIDFCANTDSTTAKTFVVFLDVGNAPGREIRIQLKIFFSECSY